MLKILIADDEAYIRLLLEQTLEDFEDKGVEILSAKDGSEALDIILKEKPNLVFLDVMMPKISGFEICKNIKRIYDKKEVYVIILTAKGEEIDKKIAEEVGVDLYITKPFDPNVIISKAAEVLKIEL